jgi:hypothetical protein
MNGAATWLVRVAGYYLAIGIIFGLFFIMRGAGKIDPSTRQTGWGFKLIILPGVSALWPLLAWRLLLHQNHPPVECNAHRQASGGS